MSGFDVQRVRADFPILRQEVRGRPLVYLDSAATSQKPQAVIDAIVRFYQHDNANVHRGVHVLSERATEAYEGARETVRRFINARDAKEIIFVRGTTEAINLVAQTYGRKHIGPGDEVLITHIEHHANIVPWRMLCEQTGASLKVIPVDERGELKLDAADALMTERTRILAVTHVSNALGTVNPVKELTRRAHAKGIPVLVDGAQAVTHFPVDVQDLGCDFYAFSGHKMFGPTGIGVLYGRLERLEPLPPYQGGGDMIETVSFDRSTYAPLPNKFEAGTPSVGDAIGLGVAVDYLAGVGMAAIEEHERALTTYALARLSAVEGVTIHGPATAEERAGVISFTVADIHPHDLASILDEEAICVRAGHHCCQPLMARLGVVATARASLYLYNTEEEINRLAFNIERAKAIFAF